MSNTGTTLYPTAYDAFDNPSTTTLENESGFSHAALHSQVHDAIEALERALGTHTLGTAVFAKRNNETFGTVMITGGTINTVVIGTATATGGTYTSITANSAIIGTPSITGGTIATPAKIYPTVGTLTDAVGTIAVDVATAQIFELTCGTTVGNRTLANPTNASDGLTVRYRVKQNAAATGTVLWGANYRFSSDIGTPSLGTAATWNYYAFTYSAAGTKFDFVGQSKNII